MFYKLFLRMIFISSLFVLSNAAANAGEFGPFRGKIVDVETKEPIEGVVVLFEWREKHFFAGSTFIDAQETLTDKHGDFYVPGIWIFNPWKRLGMYASVIIYKSGYGSTSAIGGHIEGPWNPLLEIEWGSPKGTYIWKLEDGKLVIILKKLAPDERKKYSTPGWESIPAEKAKLLIKEINKENKFLGIGEVGPIRR